LHEGDPWDAEGADEDEEADEHADDDAAFEDGSIHEDEFDVHHEYSLLRLIQALIGDEMISCTNISTFMRSGSFISAVCSAYSLRPRLHRFLKDTIGNLILDIAIANEDLEICVRFWGDCFPVFELFQGEDVCLY
jgi:hypothetical protein